jgi:hypothetical protein
MDTNSAWQALIKANLIILGLFAFGVYLTSISDKTFKPYAKKKFSPKILKKMKIGARIFFLVLTIAFFITFVIPLLSDTITLTSQGVSWGNISHIEGKVSTCHPTPIVRCLLQSFLFKDSGDCYHLWISSTPVYNEKHYEIHYLPHSHIVLSIQLLPDS